MDLLRLRRRQIAEESSSSAVSHGPPKQTGTASNWYLINVSGWWSIIRPLGYEKVYLRLNKVADTPFRIQGDVLLMKARRDRLPFGGYLNSDLILYTWKRDFWSEGELSDFVEKLALMIFPLWIITGLFLHFYDILIQRQLHLKVTFYIMSQWMA